MERGGLTRKGWIAGGIGMEEARQGRSMREKDGGREGGKGGLTTRRGNHTVKFQPDFKTIPVGSKMRRTFRQ